jgi:hypothetical protein
MLYQVDLTLSGNLNLGLHSVRSGGASAAARSDINERKWKSDVYKDGYIAEYIWEEIVSI